MKALFYKDWITNRSGLAVNVGILLALGTAMFFRIRSGESIVYFLPWFAVTFIGIGQSGLNSGVMSRTHHHVLSMPFSRRQVILSKFIPALIVTTLLFPLSAFFGFHVLPDLHYLAPFTLIPGLVIGAFYAFYFPIQVFFRGKRALFLSLALYVLLIAQTYFFNKPEDFLMVKKMVEGIAAAPILSGVVIFGLVAGMLALSIRLTVYGYERQDIY